MFAKVRQSHPRLIIVVFAVILLFALVPLPRVDAAKSVAVDAPCTLKSSGNFLTFPTWYKYIKTGKTDANGNCTVPDLQLVTKSGAFNGTGILLVLLAIVDILLRLVGLVALAFVVYGGIRYTTSQGSPDNVQQAQSTLTNALVGLLIAVIAVAAVSFIGHRIG